MSDGQTFPSPVRLPSFSHGGWQPGDVVSSEADPASVGQVAPGVFWSRPSTGQLWVRGVSAWVTPSPAPAGVTQSYGGYNIIGASWSSPGGSYAVGLTLTAPALISSIDVYLKGPSASGVNVYVYVATDASGAPGNIVAAGVGPVGVSLNTTGRWVSFPIATWLTTGSYWIAIGASTVSDLYVAADAASGSSFTRSQVYALDASQSAWTSSTTRFSIRATLIS